MTATNASYINEFNFFDDMYSCLESTLNTVNMECTNFAVKKHQIEMKHYFEDTVDFDVMIEKEGGSVLAKIGNAVLTIINKITDTIKKLMDKILGNTKNIKTDEEIVNQMVSKHPELRDQIVKGINKEWFTVRDIAKFEKDITGLIQMLEKNAIDHETFGEKIRRRCEEFSKSAAPFVSVISTFTAFMKVIPDISKNCSQTKEAFEHLRGTCEDFKDRVDRNYGDKDVNKAQAIMNALGNVIGVTNKECEHRVQAQSGIAAFLHKIANSGAGKLVHADDTSRDARHDKVRNALDAKRQASEAEETKKKNDAAEEARNDSIIQNIVKFLSKNATSNTEARKLINDRFPGKYSDADIDAALQSWKNSGKKNP